MAERAKTLHGTNVVGDRLQHFHHFPGGSFGSRLSRFQALGGVGSNPTAAIMTSSANTAGFARQYSFLNDCSEEFDACGNVAEPSQYPYSVGGIVVIVAAF